MSFDIYVQRFRDGHAACFPRNWLEEAFDATAIKRVSSWGFSLSYPDGGGGDVYVTGDDVHGFSIAGAWGQELFDRLFDLMRRADLVLYWPGAGPSLTVVDLGLVEHLPPDMVAALGPARTVSSGTEIISAIAEP